jgi:hypothetical protein
MLTAPTWYNQGRIHIDRSVTYNGHPTLRYDWWGDEPAGSQCSQDPMIATAYQAPQVSEMWIEFVHKFATNFNSNHINVGGNCPVSAVKFIQIRRTGPANDRLTLTNGTHGAQWWTAHPQTRNETTSGGNCSGLGYNCRLGYGTGQDIYRANAPSGPLWDGQWHVYRVHIKFPGVKGEKTGVFEVWIDGKLVARHTGQDFINPSGDWSNRLDNIGLGANSNSGHQYATTQWWGHVKVWTSNPGW